MITTKLDSTPRDVSFLLKTQLPRSGVPLWLVFLVTSTAAFHCSQEAAGSTAAPLQRKEQHPGPTAGLYAACVKPSACLPPVACVLLVSCHSRRRVPCCCTAVQLVVSGMDLVAKHQRAIWRCLLGTCGYVSVKAA